MGLADFFDFTYYAPLIKLMKIKEISLVLISLFILAGCGGSPDDPEALVGKGKEALVGGDDARALQYFRKAFKLNPSGRDVLYFTGLTFKSMDMLDSAISYMRRAKILYPGDRPVNEELLKLCQENEDYECALKAVYSLISLGDNEKMYWQALADFSLATERFHDAIKYYRLLIDENPDNPRYYLNISGAFTRLERFDESIDILNKSIDRFGPNPAVYSNIAFDYVEQKKYDLAEEYFRKAVALEPDYVLLKINLAHVLSEQDSRAKKEEALNIYKTYVMDVPEELKVDSLIRALEKELD
jgi:tetratricopeptide (TPR) repeat protein